jgi:hypothetical protein
MELVNNMEKQLEEYKQRETAMEQAETSILHLHESALVKLNERGEIVPVAS